MAVSSLRKRIEVVRRDIGNLLFHFTRRRETSVAEAMGIGAGEEGESAYSILERILSDGYLRGSSHKIRGGHKCVCFTEAPISELAATFSLVRIAANEHERVLYEPYGIAVPKIWLYKLGGRPVIYQADEEFETLPADYRFRHVLYDPPRGVDFTWEREWRIETNELVLEPEASLVVVPNADESFELMYNHCTLEAGSLDRDGNVEDVFHQPVWRFVSLDLFGFEEEAG